jgi:putative FmdB family regulatory protein
MPIYEFYCEACHTVYSFFAKTVNTDKRPDCPDCGRSELERQVSLFATTGEAKEPGDTDDLPVDGSKMEQAMESLAGEAATLNEDDPRQAAQLMRKLSHETGLQYGSGIEEALGRMEAGEDPETIEAEMGDRLESEDPFVLPSTGGTGSPRGANRLRRPPRRDETLHEL